MSVDASLTERLQLFMQGDRAASDALLREVFPKLRDTALRALNLERHVAPVSKTELISELWVRSLSSGGWQIRDRGHFFALACFIMRRILVDMARKRLALRRGRGETALPLDESGVVLKSSVQETERIVEVGMLMERLDAKDPDAARIVDMQYYCGFTLEEIAKETGLTLKQVRSRGERGLKRLKRMLQAKSQGGPSSLPDMGV
jgi:RNA polymerase sigma factor (TIGR02999 family)